MITQRRAIVADKSKRSGSKAGVDFVGWRDPDYLYLLPAGTFQSVARFCHDTSDHLPRSDRLRRDLKKDGLSETDKDRLTATVWIGSRSQRVLKINIAAAEAALKVEDWF